jgi:hypothetical protein
MSPYRPRAGRTARIVRRIGLDGNPMRRATDHVQAILRAVLVTLFVTGGPIGTATIAHGVYAAGLREARVQAAAWHRVPAIVLRATTIATAWRHPAATGGPVVLSVRWTMPDGSFRTGQTGYARNAAAGSTVTVWTGGSGRLTHPPFSHAAALDRAVGAAIVTPAVLALLLCAADWAVAQVLDRRRLMSWEADWLTVEPQWTRRQ